MVMIHWKRLNSGTIEIVNILRSYQNSFKKKENSKVLTSAVYYLIIFPSQVSISIIIIRNNTFLEKKKKLSRQTQPLITIL